MVPSPGTYTLEWLTTLSDDDKAKPKHGMAGMLNGIDFTDDVAKWLCKMS